MSFSKVLILAGVHGCEPQSVDFALACVQKFDLVKQESELFDLYQNEQFILIPDFNRFGLAKNIRVNENGVDLNRNLPSLNWSAEFEDKDYYPGVQQASEKQTQALVEIINSNKPDLIISIHTTHFVTHPTPAQVNFDGEKDSNDYKFAQELADKLSLPLTCDIGYPTPGSLGSYALDKKIPCITLELDDELNAQELLTKYSSAFNLCLQQSVIIKKVYD